MKYGIKVTCLNPEELKNLYTNHGVFSATCYGTKTNGNPKILAKIGEACELDGHMSGSRCEYIKFEIEADRGTLEQALRSEVGCRQDPNDIYLFEDLLDLKPRISPDEVVKNMASFRYIDKDGFGFATPLNIENIQEANDRYCALMAHIDNERREIKQILVDNGVSNKKAVEDANLVLPRATISKTTIGFTPEALIRFENMRLCTRAQEFIHQVAIEIKKIVMEINPKFGEELKANCQRLLYCPEGDKSCGLAPTKAQVKELISQYGYQYKDSETNKYVTKKD